MSKNKDLRAIFRLNCVLHPIEIFGIAGQVGLKNSEVFQNSFAGGGVEDDWAMATRRLGFRGRC